MAISRAAPSTPPVDRPRGAAARDHLVHGRVPGQVDPHQLQTPELALRHPTAEVVPLPWEPADSTGWDLLGALLRDLTGLTRADWRHPVDVQEGRLLSQPPGQLVSRPAPSGGALYPVECYVATGDTLPSPVALHHYDPVRHALRPLRPDDHRAALAATLTVPPAQPPELLLVLTTVFWRTGFKYREFGYRLQHQESGALTAQASAVADAWGATMTSHVRFDDQRVNELLGIDTFRQSASVVLSFRFPRHRADASTARPTAGPTVRPDEPPRPALAEVATPPPDIRELLPYTAALHAAALREPPDARLPDPVDQAPAMGPAIRLPRTTVCLADGVATRCSASNGFQPQPIEPTALAAVLRAAAGGYPGDLPDTPRAPAAISLYCVVSRVSGIPTGAYRYQCGELVPVGPADAIARLAGPLVSYDRLHLLEAAAVVVPVAAVEPGLRSLGDRWYRYLLFETGVALQRAALATAALGLAARIRSDGVTEDTNEALGLTTTALTCQSTLPIGIPRAGQALSYSLRPGQRRHATSSPRPRR